MKNDEEKIKEATKATAEITINGFRHLYKKETKFAESKSPFSFNWFIIIFFFFYKREQK